MEFGILQILLVGVWGFIAGIDQFSLLESLYQPLVSGAVVGLILGDLNTGLVVGGTYQLITLGNMPVGGAQPPNAVVGGIMAVVFAVSSGQSVDVAVGLAFPFAFLGQQFVNILFTAMAGFMAKADAYAENADLKGITRLNWTAMCVLGGAFAVICMLGTWGGSVLGAQVAEFAANPIVVKLLAGLAAAGGMMKFVGFAVLLRIMLSNDLWGIFFAGFTGALLFGAAGLGGQTVLLLTFVGVAIALYDYNTNIKIRRMAGSAVVGGEEDGI